MGGLTATYVPYCKHVQELAAHLLFQCHYIVRVWGMIKIWLGLHDVHPSDSGDAATVKVWWSHNAFMKTRACP